MSIAGQEYTNVYRVFLHLQQGEAPEQVIWRADVPRSDENAPMTLDCLLDRPVALGEACRLHDAAEREWFVAQGEATFRSLCADCHGGADPSGRDELAAKPPDLTRIAERAGGEFDWDTVAHWIEGRSMPSDHRALEMPVWGERLSLEYARYAEGDALIGAKLDPLIAYLEHIQQR
jgi:mono/diheme cytochrome c family protein